MILYSGTYERAGNDSWLIDIIEIHSNAIGLNLIHMYKHNGWNGEDKGTYTIELDSDDIEASQEIIDGYINERGFDEDCYESRGLKVNLREILERRYDNY